MMMICYFGNPMFGFGSAVDLDWDQDDGFRIESGDCLMSAFGSVSNANCYRTCYPVEFCSIIFVYFKLGHGSIEITGR